MGSEPFYQSGGDSLVSIPLPAGTLSHLQIKMNVSDPGRHGFTVYINSSPVGISCNTWTPSATDHCESASDQTATVNDGDVMSIGVGEGGYDPGGGEYVRWSIQLAPPPAI